MSNPVIPRGLRPLADPYSFTGPESVIRTQVGGGNARYVQQWRGGKQTFSVSMILEPFEFLVWDAFYLHKIGEGSRYFDMYLDSGSGVSLHPCHILPGTYSAKRTNGVATTVAFQVEARSQTWDISEADVDILLALHEALNPSVPAILARLAKFALVDTNVLDF